MLITSRPSPRRSPGSEAFDIELEDWEYQGIQYCMVGVVDMPIVGWGAHEEPEHGPATVLITSLQTYNETKQDWEDNPAAFARLKDDAELHKKIVEAFWGQSQSNAEQHQEDMAERR